MNFHKEPEPEFKPRSYKYIPIVIVCSVVAILSAGTFLLRRSQSKINKEALADTPKRVSVSQAKKVMYRASRRYIGTLEPWVSANIGPQLVSAYLDTVLVRPGTVVKKGDVLATLDCRNSTTESQAVAMQARAFEVR